MRIYVGGGRRARGRRLRARSRTRSRVVEQPLDLDAVAVDELEREAQETDRGGGALVGQHCGVPACSFGTAESPPEHEPGASAEEDEAGGDRHGDRDRGVGPTFDGPARDRHATGLLGDARGAAVG
jgi:hypothetical protein